MDKEHKYCGECIFCTSTCPKCGSTNIRVKYATAFEYENDTKDQITIFHDYGGIELECLNCAKWIELECSNWGEWGESSNFECDERLIKLRKALIDQLNLSSITKVSCENEIDENGKIKFKVEKLNIVSRVISGSEIETLENMKGDKYGCIS